MKEIIGPAAIDCLAHNLRSVAPEFDSNRFCAMALDGLEPLGILARGRHVAQALRQHLPRRYEDAAQILLASLTPPLSQTSEMGLTVFFYLPHTAFASEYGLDFEHNGGEDPFEISMQLQYALTRRFTAEFSIRRFLIRQPARTLARLAEWVSDPDPHVRRLCSEGTRPRLPWATRITDFVRDPSPALPILEALKDDTSLYVRRSVANHLGDIAKDHPALAFALCERWLEDASEERKWLIRHALRHPAKNGNPQALALRKATQRQTKQALKPR